MKAFIVSLLICSTGHANVASKALLDYVAEQVVLISSVKGNTRYGGTAFYVQTPLNRVVLITNAHVCVHSVEGNMEVVPESGEGFSTAIIKQNKKSDLCALESHGHSGGLIVGEKTYCPEKTFSVGHPDLEPLKFTFAGLCDRVFLARVKGGSSGSPVVNLTTLTVSGVIESRSVSGTPVGFVVTQKELKSFLGDL